MEKLFGNVQYVPNCPFSYARVSVPQRDGLPLSLKATLGPYSYRDLKPGDVVEVERTDKMDARKYAVVRILGRDAVNPSTKKAKYICDFSAVEARIVALSTESENVEAFRKDQDMSAGQMSKDRVRFFISAYYYNSGTGYALQRVLEQSFGLSHGQSQTLMEGNDFGFWIVCRPSQFARFMIYRNQAGIKNGFMDLKAELVEPTPPKDAYTVLAESTGVRICDVHTVANVLGLTTADVRERMHKEANPRYEIDVSKNPAKG